MPGLFGILDLSSKSISEEERANVFMKMAATLRHDKEDRLGQGYMSGSNLMIGRIGLPGQNPLRWPIRPDGTESGIHPFVSALLEREPDEPISGMLNRVAVRNWHKKRNDLLNTPDHTPSTHS